jgi:hypothetical protein
MTLVITEISRFGVIMAANTAETRSVKGTSGAEYTRVNSLILTKSRFYTQMVTRRCISNC